MHDVLNDAFEPEVGIGAEEHESASNNSQETNNRGSKFDDLIKEVEEKVHQNHIEESNKLCPGRAIGGKLHLVVSIHKRRRSSNTEIDEKSLTQAHRYVLFNIEAVTPFREIHGQQFDDWFRRTQHSPKYIPPMSINRVANLRKLCRVFASNNTQEVPSTSNATKQTLSETIEGNKRRAKRRTVLNDEDDDIFEEGNRVDMELDDFHHDYEYENMDDTLHTNNRIDAQMIDHDNLQQQIQHLDNEKATGAPKKVRSHTQKARIWKMVSNERILVMFNKFGKPMGDECKELVQYLGTLVRMPEHVSIEYSDWRKAPMQQKEYMYSLVKLVDGMYLVLGGMPVDLERSAADCMWLVVA
ncbi:hypothetical protein E3N88_23849 [Mikania micrantha]|uniref:Uncharacterized protein n=1 Tax=Mikania micrantha TaxID=192012 RepID=A0A5N6NH38_9ASTR|nr:hypothetical protein E3N88_23849 [Mikania micrantha]